MRILLSMGLAMALVTNAFGAEPDRTPGRDEVQRAYDFATTVHFLLRGNDGGMAFAPFGTNEYIDSDDETDNGGLPTKYILDPVNCTVVIKWHDGEDIFNFRGLQEKLEFPDDDTVVRKATLFGPPGSKASCWHGADEKGTTCEETIQPTLRYLANKIIYRLVWRHLITDLCPRH